MVSVLRTSVRLVRHLHLLLLLITPFSLEAGEPPNSAVTIKCLAAALSDLSNGSANPLDSELQKTLIESSKRPREVEIELERVTPHGGHLKGRIIEVNERYLSPEFTMLNEDGQRTTFSANDIVPDSIKASRRPLSRPQLPTGLTLPSEIARNDDVNYIVRATNISKIEKIFSAGKLTIPSTRDLWGTHGEPALYLEAMGKNVRGTLFETDFWNSKWKIKLIFDPVVLDHGGFHMSRGWPAGEMTPESALPTEIQKLHEIMWDLSNGFQDANEIVFPGPVSLENLKAIWVEPEDRDPVIQILKKIGYQPPDGLSVDDFVVVQKTWP